MASDKESVKARVTLLNGGNYSVWKVKIKATLLGSELWDNVEQPKPQVVNDAWKKANNKAMAKLLLAIEDDQVVHVGQLETAHEIWVTFQRMYERSTLGSRLYLRRKLYTSRFTSGTMRAHINAIVEIVSQLKTAGTIVEDGEVVAALLASLPESYSGLVTALEGRDEEALTIEYVTGKMQDEYQRRVEDVSQDGAELALRTATGLKVETSTLNAGRFKRDKRKEYKSKKEGRECFFCHKPGHIKADCRAWKRSQQQPGSSSGSNAGNAAANIAGRGNAQQEDDNPGGRRKTEFATFKAATGSMTGWLVDSGASSHMTNDRTLFTSLNMADAMVRLAGKTSLVATGIGTVVVHCNLPGGGLCIVKLQDVLYVPELDCGLISVSKMQRQGHIIEFDKKGMCKIKRGNKVLATAQETNGLYTLNTIPIVADAKFVGCRVSLGQWHRRLGHRDPAALRKLVSEDLVLGMELDNSSRKKHSEPCESCIKGKFAKLPFTASESRAAQPLDLVHSDVCGPMPTVTPSGNRYVLTLVDDYSRFTMVHLLRHKSEAKQVIEDYIAFVENKFGRKPKVLRTDNGTEYVNQPLQRSLASKGVEHQFTVVYTPEQNGVAERKNRSLTEMTRCMLLDSELPKRFWGEAILTAAYLQNRLPSRSINKTPYELWNGVKPDISHIRVFGSKVYTHVPKILRKKLDDTANEGVLIGYGDVTKGYRVLDVRTSKVRMARSIRIIETDCDTGQSKTSSEELIEADKEAQPTTTVAEPEGDSSEIEDSGDEEEITPQGPPLVPTPQSPPLVPPAPEEHQRRVSQRTNKGQLPQRYCQLAQEETCTLTREPATWNEVLELPEPERNRWLKAAEEEMQSLKQHNVWDLTPLPAGKRAISAKWVFKAKQDGKGDIHTFKARLVARGFAQRFGTDYDETYAPVVKHETVRVLLAVAAARKLHVRHLDVKTAYLNGELDEELYMEQPEGFVQSGQETLVCKLRKSLYGLKQSARAWNKMASTTLNKIGFQRGAADNCLYTRVEEGGNMSYVLLYVDDILVVGSSEWTTKAVGEELQQFFEIKDLGNVANYLGLQVEREKDGSFLIHQNYKISQLLEVYGMQNCKPAATPMETGFLATTMDSPNLPNNKEYRKAIGSLLYLATVSRPDISVAVGIMCRRVEQPTEADWKSLKRIMRYLSRTRNWKLRLFADTSEELTCFVDADWAGDHKDRKSTSGYVFQLGDSVIAWASKKQTTVALSSTEAEYVAASTACRELLWLRELMTDLGINMEKPVTVLEDNQGCIRMVDSDKCGARTKHISVCHHLLRDLREQGIIEMLYCPTSEMLADIFTKPLPKIQFNKFAAGLRLCM